MSEPATTRQFALPLPQSAACSVCGKPFEVVRQRGRPQIFCGDVCRRIQQQRQMTHWNNIRHPSRPTRAERPAKPPRPGARMRGLRNAARNQSTRRPP